MNIYGHCNRDKLWTYNLGESGRLGPRGQKLSVYEQDRTVGKYSHVREQCVTSWELCAPASPFHPLSNLDNNDMALMSIHSVISQ